jgi:hypothetical protein
MMHQKQLALTLPPSTVGLSRLSSFDNSPQRQHAAEKTTPFQNSLPAKALQETITTLESKLSVNLEPLGYTLMSLWNAIHQGLASRHKAILLVGFTQKEEKEISEGLQNLLTLWQEHARDKNLSTGLASHKKGQLTPITPKEEDRIHQIKNKLNTSVKYADTVSLIGIVLLSLLFNAKRIFSPKDSLGKEYGDDNYILKHVTFTQFDLLILNLIPTLALIAKYSYLQTWKSPIIHSTLDKPYAEVQDDKTDLLTGSDHLPGAFHRAHGGILWVGKNTIANQACRNLLRTGLTLGYYETPQGPVPNAFLTIVSTGSLVDMAGTENDGRFTVIAKHTYAKQRQLSDTKNMFLSTVAPTMPLKPPAITNTTPLKGTPENQSKKLRDTLKSKKEFIDLFQQNYATYLDYPNENQWKKIHAQVNQRKTDTPLVLITGLDDIIDSIFTHVEARDIHEPYLLLLSGPYGAAKTTIGKVVAETLSTETPRRSTCYHALKTNGGRIEVITQAGPYTPGTTHLTVRQIAAGMGAGMALMFTIVNIAVTDSYRKEGVGFQDGLDRLQFPWMLLVAWITLMTMVAQHGYALSKEHDNEQTLIMDFSTPNTIGSANEDLLVTDLYGKELKNPIGLPHNHFSFEGALLLRHAGLFAENWDALASEPKNKIRDSILSGTVQIPTGHTLPTRSQFLVATTNHPEKGALDIFTHHDFSLVVPWKPEDDLMIIANIIGNTEPHTPLWEQDALTTFLDLCRNKKNQQAVLTRQILVDIVRDIGNSAYYSKKESVTSTIVNEIWRNRVFEGPLSDIYAAYRLVHGLQ